MSASELTPTQYHQEDCICSILLEICFEMQFICNQRGQVHIDASLSLNEYLGPAHPRDIIFLFLFLGPKEGMVIVWSQ